MSKKYRSNEIFIPEAKFKCGICGVSWDQQQKQENWVYSIFLIKVEHPR